MKNKAWKITVALIFLLTLGTRLYIAFQTPNFSDDNAYFNLRQVESITETGFPIYDDELSYGGRTFVFLPFFHYIIAFFALFIKLTAAAKIIPNIFASALVIIVYLIARHLVKDENISVLCAFASGFIPIFFSETINSFSVSTLSIPLMFLMLYTLLKIKSRRYIYYFLLILCISLLTSTHTILFVMAMLLYYIFSWVEGFKPTRSEIELILFSLFLTTWFYFIFFRDALLMHGFGIIWQNIPSEVLNEYYSEVTILEAIGQIGLIPLVAGIAVMYYYIFRKKKKSMYLFLSQLIIIAGLLLLRYIQLKAGLIYIGIISAILLSESVLFSVSYFEKTKFSRLKNIIIAGLFVIFIITSLLPTVSFANKELKETDPSGKVFAVGFLKNISKEGDMIVGSVFDGHLITYKAERKNIIDSNFLMTDAKERIRDVRTIYTSAISSRAIQAMEKYGADYIIVTDEALDYYNITRVSYFDDACFPLRYSSRDVKVYERKC